MNVVMALRHGGSFGRRDVALLAHHIHRTSDVSLYCLTDKALDVDGVTDIHMEYAWPRWWCRMELYAPHMKYLRPFLFVDLDTIVLGSLNELAEAIPDKDMYVPLEDFYQGGKLATGLLWMPLNNKKVNKVWLAWHRAGFPAGSSRMDYFLRKHIKADVFWQQITDKVKDFKPRSRVLLKDPGGASVVCLHGRPSIWDADLEWVKRYRDV